MHSLPEKVIDAPNGTVRRAVWIGRLLVIVFGVLTVQNVLAQGCAMCYTSAAAAKKAGIEALQNGILILLVPPLLMFVLIAWHTFRRKGSGWAGDSADEMDDGDSVPGQIYIESNFPGSRKSNSIGVKSFLRE